MPMHQVAAVQNYDFGAPISGNHLPIAAAATLDPAGANNAVVYTARTRGTYGNTITIAYVVAGLNTPLTISVVGKVITVNVATDGAGAATSTANQIRAAIAALAASNALVSAANATGNDGSGVVAAVSATALAGGQEALEAARVLKFRVDEQSGGQMTLLLSAEASPVDLSFTVLVSEDGTNWWATTASDNAVAVSGVTVKSRTHYSVTVALRAGKDKYLAFAVTGGNRGQVQIRESNLQIIRI